MPLSGAINVWVNASPLFSRNYRGRGFCGGPGAAAGFRSSAAADLRDQIDLAIGFERGEVGVLENLAIDRRRHAHIGGTMASPRYPGFSVVAVTAQVQSPIGTIG